MMFPRSLNKDLYGPSRVTANTAIKDILLRDHVLQEGEWYSDIAKQKPWTTSFAISFEKPSVDPSNQHVRKQKVQTNITSFVLGSTEGPLLATTASNFDNKFHGAPEKAAPNKSTSIPDFAPKYMSDKTFGKSGSVYVSSFAKKNQGQASSAKNRAECKQHTSDLNATHFQFGTDANKYSSETKNCFKNKSEIHPKDTGFINVASKTALETYKSSVFRNGDWNVAEPCLVRHSVTCNDFHIKPFSTEDCEDLKEQKEKNGELNESEKGKFLINPKDDPSHPYYQRSTHFVLGTNKDDGHSLYYKDFMLGTRESLKKPLPAPPPISSKVLPNLEDCLPWRSTNMSDFVDHGTQISQRRAAETKLNRERQNTLAVSLTCDEQRHAADRQVSMTGSSYLHPPGDMPYLSPQKEPRSKYRYLDSNGALLKSPLWPKPSETKDEFIPHIEEFKIGEVSVKLKDKKADCVGRIRDNRKTHFQFGSDDEPKHSEQRDQFFSSIRLDPSLPAAGKREGPGQKYSHVFPSESAEQGRQSARDSHPLDEVTKIKKHLQELGQQRYFNTSDAMNINLRKAFLEFDTSLSGRISKDDLKNVLRRLSISMDTVTFENLTKMCDKNNSGYIDYREFGKHLAKDAPLTKGGKASILSVMKADYCPPEQRRFTSAQQRTIEVSKKVVPLSVSSHYFHKHQSEAPRLSTTAQDFVRPDRMPGTPRLFVQ